MLTITGRQLRLQSCHYHAIVAQRFPASVTPAPPPLSEGGGVTEAEETVSLSSSSLRREEKPRMGFWECGSLCSS